MAVKQVAQGTSSIFKAMWANKAATATVAGMGTAGSALAMLGPAQKWGGIPSTVNNDAFSPREFKHKSFLERQSIHASLGMFGEMSGGATGAGGLSWGAVKGVANYNWQRTKDMYLTSGLPGGADNAAGKASRWGMTGGAVAGGLAGLVVGGLTKMPIGRAVLGFAGLGAATGGYQARKVSLQVMEAFNEAKKSSLDRNRMSNRARTMGSGFRSWTRGNRKGRPGHLGMDGSVPFSMHKARHRSTI